VLLFWRRTEVALQFLTGYLIEKALSIDILFVFLLILSYFQVPPQFQHTVLFWGIFGALVMRFILIALGLSLNPNLPLSSLRLRRFPRAHGPPAAI
jgi:predicted tellurium resistance membrane protein TerC